MISRTPLKLLNIYKIQQLQDDDLTIMLSEEITKFNNINSSNQAESVDLEAKIDNIADIYLLVGEVVSRWSIERDRAKLLYEQAYSKAIIETKQEWVAKNTAKAPAIDYFKALAIDVTQQEREDYYVAENKLLSFKNAYRAYEEKLNGIKKIYDGVIRG